MLPAKEYWELLLLRQVWVDYGGPGDLIQQVKALVTQTGNLSSIPRALMKVEREDELQKLPSYLYMCAVACPPPTKSTFKK